MATAKTQHDSPELPPPGHCWCCGCIDDPESLVHLGEHPEVAVCTRCAHSLHTWAWEREDRAKTGPGVRVRDAIRRLRRRGFEHGWHTHQYLGKPLRWLGKHIP